MLSTQLMKQNYLVILSHRYSATVFLGTYPLFYFIFWFAHAFQSVWIKLFIEETFIFSAALWLLRVLMGLKLLSTEVTFTMTTECQAKMISTMMNFEKNYFVIRFHLDLWLLCQEDLFTLMRLWCFLETIGLLSVQLVKLLKWWRDEKNVLFLTSCTW